MGLLSKIGNLINVNNNLSSNKENMFINIPNDIMELLWFKDGKYKNYEDKKAKEDKIESNGITITFSFLSKQEPSLISINNMIKNSQNKDIETPGYYPSYDELTPQQRWIYLNWLKNIDNKIDISYVFLFYYGLERHLLFGDYTKAWNILCRLRKNHKNQSFISYSTNALIATCIIRNRPDLFIQLLEDTEDVDDMYISDLYLLAKYKLYGEIMPKEVMAIASKVGFKNNRYIKNESLVFEDELSNILFERYNKNGIDLRLFDLKKCPEKDITLIANISIDERYTKIPSLLENGEFKTYIHDLLSETHEITKTKLKEIRKSQAYVPSIKPKKREKKEPDKIFKESILFEKIDTNIFDKNEEFYDHYICPYCKEKVEKLPVSKGKCTKCKNDILIKNSIFTGVKIALTKEENELMVNIRNERARRHFIDNIINNLPISAKEVKKVVSKRNITIEEALIEEIEKISVNEKLNNNMGIYRCYIMDRGRIYEKMGNLKEALKLYMLVCYYDLNGATNGGSIGLGYDKNQIFLAPAVIDWIKKITKSLKLSEEDLYNLLNQVIKDKKENEMFINDNVVWKCMYKAIYEDILVRGTYEEILEQLI
ncbi:TerB N-terminal domain-containing protein [Terrisporobacter mayombei]|uniref:TerB N-terminal domain-containing protein n=1 Tax=Terrisporobacter mayombei TaxID=1541 RepID=A0ABY9PZK6_9FIRM|nr:TerB N-terminal domain-containing protein [Terrisporobacter mayombei]MCC3868648.1 TerB N-terminal domain-containing protein [Terrisporobacter mayombei]WMT80804.1 hypothetical protein TEMA_11260 [Terrisporobacter mayombei]